MPLQKSIHCPVCGSVQIDKKTLGIKCNYCGNYTNEVDYEFYYDNNEQALTRRFELQAEYVKKKESEHMKVQSDNVLEIESYDSQNKTHQHAFICEELNSIYEAKNADYGDSFGKGYKEYGMTMPCIRLEDKLSRLKSLSKQDAKVKDESIEDTLLDLANYVIMTLIELRGDK